MTRMVSTLAVGVTLGVASHASADAVTGWNANAGRAAVAACISPADDPLHESRMYAMMHVAIHDASRSLLACTLTIVSVRGSNDAPRPNTSTPSAYSFRLWPASSIVRSTM